jgi:hypothetical protein
MAMSLYGPDLQVDWEAQPPQWPVVPLYVEVGSHPDGPPIFGDDAVSKPPY